MNVFRSVGARLSLALMLVVAAALGVLYLIVVPLLERNLTEAKLRQLERTAAVEAGRFPPLPDERRFRMFDDDEFGLTAAYREALDIYVEQAAVTTNARVVVIAEPLEDATVLADSHSRTGTFDPTRDQLALVAAFNLVAQRAIVRRGDDAYAEVAVPLVTSGTGDTRDFVLLAAAPLDDTLANVQLVKRRVLVAGGVALLVALLLGYGGASVFAARIKRLERAADRIASGRLDEPVVDEGNDELGQLAHAFERMRQRLAQLEHARREFIANASHELRTPIFSLGGFLELLDDEELDEATRREFLTTMQGQVERLGKLATDLLDLSRLDAGRLHVEREPLELARLVDELVEEFAPAARASEHALEVEVDPEAPPALADELRVLQIGRVLVENALLHTPPGTRVRVRVAAGERGAARLAVEDDGPGIAAEHATHVFERFYRIEGAVASGSGLGLAIARELAELMGGALELDSRPGRTVFTLTLAAAAPGPARGAPVEAAAAG